VRGNIFPLAISSRSFVPDRRNDHSDMPIVERCSLQNTITNTVGLVLD